MRFEVTSAMALEGIVFSDDGEGHLGTRVNLSPTLPGLLNFDGIDIVIRVRKGLCDARSSPVKPRQAM